MRGTSRIHTLVALVVFLLTPVVLLAGTAPGDASGTVVVNGKSISMKFACGKRTVEDGEKTTSIILTDRPASRALLGDSNRFYRAVKEGKLQAMVIDLAADGTVKQVSLYSKLFQNDSMPVGASRTSYQPSTVSPGLITAKARSTEEQTFFDDTATFDVVFSAPIGDGKFADSPSAVAQLAASAPKIGEGGAAGTLTFDGKVAKLGYALATTQPDPFDKSKKDVVVYLTDRPMEKEAVLSFRKMANAIESGLQGMVVTIDESETPTHLELLRSPSIQVSGSGIFSFDPLQFDARQVEGRFYTTGTEEFMDHKYAYDVTFRVPVQTVVDPQKPEVDASSGKKLPSGGGEPGKAYLALDKAIRGGDLKGVLKLAAKGVDSPLNASPEEQKQMMEMLKMIHPTNVKIVDGFSDGTHATLHVVGDDPMEEGKKAKGTIHLVLEDGGWKIAGQEWSN
ncbi:MAG: hypothetical protein WBX15_02185 [Thermoanaerobaculia bacterium]